MSCMVLPSGTLGAELPFAKKDRHGAMQDMREPEKVISQNAIPHCIQQKCEFEKEDKTPSMKEHQRYDNGFIQGDWKSLESFTCSPCLGFVPSVKDDLYELFISSVWIGYHQLIAKSSMIFPSDVKFST